MGSYVAIARRALEALKPLQHTPMDSDEARQVLNRRGCRVMRLHGQITIGVWPDLDGPELRAALEAVGMARLPVRSLDGLDIPARYRVRLADRSPCPIEGEHSGGTQRFR